MYEWSTYDAEIVANFVFFIYLLKQIYILYDIEQGSIAIAGAAVKWLRDNLGLIKDASELGIVPFLFAFFFLRIFSCFFFCHLFYLY